MEEREESSDKVKDYKTCQVNTKLLPIKLHYFFSFGSFAAVIPFMPIVAKEINISATALGIVYSIMPIFTFLANPIIGLFVDYLQNIKVILIILLLTSSVAFSSIFFLPIITYEVAYIKISHFNQSKALLNIPTPFKKSCLEKVLLNDTKCRLVLLNENKLINDTENGDLHKMINLTYIGEQINNTNQTDGNTHWMTFYTSDTIYLENEGRTNSLNIECFPSISQCIYTESHNIFTSYQFWVFFIVIVYAAATNASAASLTSVACFEILGANSVAYGRQRMFGTIGWGIVCPLAGLLSDHFERDFMSVTYISVILRIIDIAILSVTRLPKTYSSSNMSRDLRIIFTSKEILVFSCGIVLIGFLCSIIDVFEFWFLDEIGANRTLLGLSILMQCLVGEVPFLFFSGWFANKFGHFLCFTCVFIGYLLRLILYFFLKNPWYVLPIDTLHGLTFGLFHGAMASFGKEKAPKGMEATLLGLFAGLYEGLGYGLGSSLGGFGLDKLGSRQTFLSASILSFGCFLSFLFASYVFRSSRVNKKCRPVPLEME